MRRGRLLGILTAVFAVGGMVCIARGAWYLFQFEDATALAFAGAVMLLFSGVAGMLNSVILRGNCRKLAKTIRKCQGSPQLSSMHAEAAELNDLVVAMNDLVEFSEKSVSDAALRLNQLEIELKVATAQRQHAEAILYSISDAVLVTDPFDELLLANDAAARVFNFELGDSSRRPIGQVLSDEKVVAMICEMRQSNSTNGRRIVEHTVAGGNGPGRTFKITLSCVSDNTDKPAGVVAVLQDMTKEKEVAEMKNDFVSSVSHELRTPLASIKAYVEMLIDGEADDEKTKREFYEVIQNEANRLSRLIDNILNISRIESGLVKINKQPQSLTVILKEAVEVINPQASGKKIVIKEELSPIFYRTLADRDMLYQAALNLLSNAVKYTPEGGTITVKTIADESKRKIITRISDTGVGIPPKDLPFVFDKFYRAEANNRMAKGTGLGLSLVKHIIETVHHGRIFVESHVGKGSCFGFELDSCD